MVMSVVRGAGGNPLDGLVIEAWIIDSAAIIGKAVSRKYRD
jgi:hypothetical protein